jgi:hypothetical protein
VFREFLRWALGPWGREILQFYQEYNVAINAVVIIYGIVIFYPHFTLVKLINRLERMILEISSRHDQPDDFEKIWATLFDRWMAENRNKTFILPTKNDLWFEPFSGEKVFELLQIERDYIRIALHKQTGHPPQRSFEAINFKIWEKYRRQLKKGLRSNTPAEIHKMRKNANVR